MTTRLQAFQKDLVQNQQEVAALQTGVKKMDSKIDGQTQMLDSHTARLDAMQTDIKRLVDALLPTFTSGNSKTPVVESTATKGTDLTGEVVGDTTPIYRGAGILGSGPYPLGYQATPQVNPHGSNLFATGGNSFNHNMWNSLYSGPVRYYKCECPKFNGEDFKGWYVKLEQYFLAENVPEEMKVRVVMLSLEGDALQWHQYHQTIEGGLGSLSWESYMEAMRERFASDEVEDPMSALVELKQDDTVVKYHQAFIRNLNLLQIPTSHAMSIFVSNLKPEIKHRVRLHKPKNLNQALSYAKQIETIESSSNKKSYNLTNMLPLNYHITSVTKATSSVSPKSPLSPTFK